MKLRYLTLRCKFVFCALNIEEMTEKFGFDFSGSPDFNGVEEEEEEFDHLDHTRPITEVKSNYQRMPPHSLNNFAGSSPSLAGAAPGSTVIVLPGKATSQDNLAA